MSNKVIIIDSGIDSNNDLLNKRILNGVNIESEGKNIKINNKYQDLVGHGTSCASTILSVCNECEFYPIKIVDKNGESSSKLLIRALEYCEEIDIRVIGISMATINLSYYEKVEKICNRLKLQGKIIVSSLHNKYDTSAPAIFESVIGIRGKNFGGSQFKFFYDNKSGIQGVFDSTPQLALGLDGRYSFFKGNSKANALAIGNILNILEENPNMSFEELNNRLELISINDKSRLIEEADRASNCINYSNCDKQVFFKLKSILDETLEKDVDIDSLNKYPLMSRKIGLHYGNFYDYLENISKYLNIVFDYKNIKAEDVCTMGKLVSYIIKESW